jgi:hypothetical protein
MYTNVNLTAPVGVLSFLGICFVLFGCALVLVYSIVRKKPGLKKFALITIVAVTSLYLGVMLFFSLSSSEKVLARGEEKHFCEIDCHLAYSITGVEETKTFGDAPNQLVAGGQFWVVTVRTRFDEHTISPTRGNFPLSPNSRVLTVIDENRKQYFPSPDAKRILDSSHAGSAPITTPLHPGESYSTIFVFDLPADIRKPTLLMREGELVTHFVIGHENSPLHSKTRFQL